MTYDKDYYIELFINSIDNELVLRKKHLSFLHEILSELQTNNHKFTFIRTTIPELYAQYEGFLKFSFAAMFNTLKNMDPSNKDININFFIFSLLTSLDDHLIAQKAKAQRFLDVFNKAFLENQSFLTIANIKKYILNQDTLIHTSNILNYDIESSDFPVEQLNLLYSRRNPIAHGELETSNQFSIRKNRDITNSQLNAAWEVWRDDYQCVLYSLDKLKDFFIDYIKNELYLKAV